MDKTLRIAVAALPLAIIVGLILLLQLRPGFLTDPSDLAALIFLQVLLVCLWFYDLLFFPLVILAFLWAGTNVPLSETWTTGRWVVLGAGALVGIMRGFRGGQQRSYVFYIVAAMCVVSATVSALVSPAPQISLMKALSLFLLFLYGAFGGRLVLNDPDRYFRGILLACEGIVYGTALCYWVLDRAIWGNPNSLGAVHGIVVAPLLLWGTLIAPEKLLRVRRAVACLGAVYFIHFSLARAAMLASAVSIVALLLALRSYKLMARGAVVLAGIVALTALLQPASFDQYKNSLVTGVIYKGHEQEGLLGSRLSPWAETVQVIQESPYFGRGFGTTWGSDKPFGEVGRLASSSALLREHGSSYLAIIEYVGLMGVLPFVLLLMLVLRSVARVLLWVRRSGSAAHYSVPLMMVLVAGLVHAGFEDWMFSVGFYMTVLFWTFAFLLRDLEPEPSPDHTALLHGMRFRYSNNAVTVEQ